MYRAPRRICLDRLTPAELALHQALVEVENLGADTRLTEVVVMIQKARDIVADCIEGVGGKIALPNPGAVTSPPGESPIPPGQLP